MHVIHHTEAVVIKSIASGEASKRVWLYTKDFGMVVALVQGVRKPGAKLQSQVVDYAFIAADMVKGREVWRLVSARIIANPLVDSRRSPLARAYVRTLSMLLRFVVDEGVHPELFEHIRACGEVVAEGVLDARTFDAFSLWKMLVLLGYIAPGEVEAGLVPLPLSEAVLHVSDALRAQLVAQATEAIVESHL